MDDTRGNININFKMDCIHFKFLIIFTFQILLILFIRPIPFILYNNNNSLLPLDGIIYMDHMMILGLVQNQIHIIYK